MSHEFDLVVIGGGPAGYVAAIFAAQKGLKTALVEKDSSLGGTCLNRGCIPTKALLKTAEWYSKAQHLSEKGIEVTGGVRLNFPQVMSHKDQVVKQITEGVAYLMRKNKITVFQGYGVVKTPKEIWVRNHSDNPTLKTRFILLATGSQPRELPIAPTNGHSILNSDHLLALKEQPQSLGIIGGGIIGLEFASCFARYGTKISLFEKLNRLAPTEDLATVEVLHKQLLKQNCDIYLDTQIQKITDLSNTVQIETDKGVFQCEKLLIAIGRIPVLDPETKANLNLPVLNSGHVDVDLRTYQIKSHSHIYAVGDLIATPQLAHTASKEALCAVHHMLGLEYEAIQYKNNPSVIYTSPEIASVGATEEELKASNVPYVQTIFPFRGVGKARIDDMIDGFVKILHNPTYGDILGVHIVHDRASELIGEFVLGQSLEVTVEELSHVIHPHPTLSEVIGEAAHAATGFPLHI